MNQRILYLTCLGFATSAFMAAIIRFSSDKEALQAQAINWFLASLGTAMIPSLKYLPSAVESIHIGQGGVKLALKELKDELSSSIKGIEDKVNNLDLRLLETLDQVHRSETNLSMEAKLLRQQSYDSWTANVLNKMGEKEKLATQEILSLEHLSRNRITVSQLKDALSRLGYYKGSINEDYTRDLEQAVTSFQSLHVPGVPDGIPGSITLSRLREVYSGELNPASPTSPLSGQASTE